MPNQSRIQQAIAATGRLSRRDFLRFAAGTAAAGGLALAGFMPKAADATAADALPEGIHSMDAAQYRVFQRLAEVSLATEGTSLLPPSAVPVLATLDAALLGVMAPHELQGLKEGVALFEAAPTEAYGKPFSALGDTEATAFCDAWAGSTTPDERGLVTALKKLVALAYWANPPTWAPLGYDGPVSDEWGLVSIGNAPMPAE